MKESPKKLYVNIVKYDPSWTPKARAVYDRGEPFPADLEATRKKHVLHAYDLAKRGVLWAGGPSADFTVALNVYSADSLEEAKLALHNDEFYKTGLWHSDEWFQWTIHLPLEKVDPQHREVVEKGLRDWGVIR